MIFIIIGLISSLYADATFTTEFQARVSDIFDIRSALFKMNFNEKEDTYSKILYKLYDTKEKDLEKEGIVVRYRDKGKKVDLVVKLRLAYSSSMVSIIKQLFSDVDIKKEVNRYYINESSNRSQIELTFKSEKYKESLGLAKKDALSRAQIYSMFTEVLTAISAARDVLEDNNGASAVVIRSKMDKVMEYRSGGLYARSFYKFKWKLKKWGGFSPVVFEYYNDGSLNSTLEISNRISGDVQNNGFFDMLIDKDINIKTN